MRLILCSTMSRKHQPSLPQCSASESIPISRVMKAASDDLPIANNLSFVVIMVFEYFSIARVLARSVFLFWRFVRSIDSLESSPFSGLTCDDNDSVSFSLEMDPTISWSINMKEASPRQLTLMKDAKDDA